MVLIRICNLLSGRPTSGLNASGKVKELKGDFETPEDKEEYLKQMRRDVGSRNIGPLKPQKEYQDLLDSLSTIYNQ